MLSTGIGVRGWLEAADAVLLGEQLRTALSDAVLVSRGPKARGAAVTADLDVAWNAPGATSAEVIEHVRGLPVAAGGVAVQLDGAAGSRIADALGRDGIPVIEIPVYRWSLPDDLRPAQSLVRAVCDRRVDAVTFTARPAVDNFVQIAEDLDPAATDRLLDGPRAPGARRAARATGCRCVEDRTPPSGLGHDHG